MAQRLAFIHTVDSLAEQFQRLAADVMPDVETVSVVNEALLQRTIDKGRLTSETREELAQMITDTDGVDAIMVTCSTLGPAVDAARERSRVPLLRVDEPMARKAVRIGEKIGVVATLSTTLEPTVDLIQRVAADEGRSVEVLAHLCEGAFDAGKSGDNERHDSLVRDGLTRLFGEVDVVVLAQASMARAVDSLTGDPPVPVLSSPRLAVEYAAEVLHQG
ncbi:MAG: aspartate/glutamate racemase family protein [Egibacteraceae bacterium]